MQGDSKVREGEKKSQSNRMKKNLRSSFKERLEMDYTPLAGETAPQEALTKAQSQSLYEVLQKVTDGRAARGKTYELAGLIVLLVLAKLAGMKSLKGASDWIRDQQEGLKDHLKLTWKKMPCRNTSQCALVRLESQKVNECWWLGLSGKKRSAGVEKNSVVWRLDQSNEVSIWLLTEKC